MAVIVPCVAKRMPPPLCRRGRRLQGAKHIASAEASPSSIPSKQRASHPRPRVPFNERGSKGSVFVSFTKGLSGGAAGRGTHGLLTLCDISPPVTVVDGRPCFAAPLGPGFTVPVMGGSQEMDVLGVSGVSIGKHPETSAILCWSSMQQDSYVPYHSPIHLHYHVDASRLFFPSTLCKQSLFVRVWDFEVCQVADEAPSATCGSRRGPASAQHRRRRHGANVVVSRAPRRHVKESESRRVRGVMECYGRRRLRGSSGSE
ncbi:hypothetical protein E2C01_007963 [Portunus trituberculatus]|uniref:Uncharacterized protein n=1 Tax=Portunus trituberculatus TaxID=210409 RepID=A0A5B7D0I9_PORTR|nr:hypothetical protein [Portunus trituberculatus]